MIFLIYQRFIPAMSPKFFESVRTKPALRATVCQALFGNQRYKDKQIPPLGYHFASVLSFRLCALPFISNLCIHIYPTSISVKTLFHKLKNIQISLRMILN